MYYVGRCPLLPSDPWAEKLVAHGQARYVLLAKMRLVLDTNVLVSALLKPGSVPDRAMAAAWKHGVVIYDARIVDEYRSVLARPKLKLDERQVAALIDTFLADGVDVGESAPFHGAMSDDDDRMFVEVALTGRAHAIVTGNGADFPPSIGVRVLSPAMLLAQLDR